MPGGLMRPLYWIVTCVIVSWLLPLSALAKAKQYQVTGKVLEANEQMIVVQKGDEKWEIDRTSDLKIDGELKVGAKVTIHYHMIAGKVETKSDAGAEKKGK